MGCTLSSPVELIRVQRRGSSSFRCAVAEMQGWRINHEDAHAMSCTDRLGNFWVLDGHGGEAAANFCAHRLEEAVAKDSVESKFLPSNEAVEECFKKVDSEFRTFVEQDTSRDSGSTVVGATMAKHEDGRYSLNMFNCGDSRGLVVRSPLEEESTAVDCHVTVSCRGTLMDCGANDGETGGFNGGSFGWTWPLIVSSVDHKPDHPTERDRIEAAGGMVSDADPPRLDGNLAVSRGVGDFEYKCNKTLETHQQKVSCVPDIYEVSGLPTGSICVLACDGLWDVMQSVEVAEIVRESLKKEPNKDLGIVAAELIRQSLTRQSRDNVTVMIIQMVDGSDWSSSSDRFNNSDEMLGFGKLQGASQLEDDVRRQYIAFLKKCNFPPEPEVCSITGRWFHSMWRCPGTGNIYSNRSCQKIGWRKHKKKERKESMDGDTVEG
eukprot:CAMPEP_0117529014 /NCGR_PEP_ID=MMETSP0784-20121206/37615_1 /TAXON_ID=39447 /ORGANISM="" /LENGTH=434 /DNA_ID=CAMNT_0005325325 /DNA_START=105 /DNA_END=1405 /DNA_ORIENTATION=+